MKPSHLALVASLALLVGCSVPTGAQDEKPLPKEVKVLIEKAEKGDAAAQHSLAFMYDYGQGVPQDFRKSVKWYRKSADQGYVKAQYDLGYKHEYGRGVSQDYKEAVKWYRKSADQGYAVSQLGLGVMYVKGQGVPEDIVSAYAWFNIAASNGDTGARRSKEMKEIVAKKMTKEQITDAQKLSSELAKKIAPLPDK
ncbi:MAG: tetratricopeptide repeat protein [Planctomycetota bacterium]|jgi:hypothetical protein|nr:tetratricopeptide repeat protein [Planctomycetota bacterium]